MGAVGVGLDGPGDLAIEGEGFVQIAGHKRLENIAIKPLGGGARLQVEGIEAVEGALGANHQPPALGGLGVGVGQVDEAGRQGGLAMHGDPMGALSCKGRVESSRRDRQEDPGEEANRTFFHGLRLKKCDWLVIVRLCALIWSFFSPRPAGKTSAKQIRGRSQHVAVFRDEERTLLAFAVIGAGRPPVSSILELRFAAGRRTED